MARKVSTHKTLLQEFLTNSCLFIHDLNPRKELSLFLNEVFLNDIMHTNHINFLKFGC